MTSLYHDFRDRAGLGEMVLSCKRKQRALSGTLLADAAQIQEGGKGKGVEDRRSGGKGPEKVERSFCRGGPAGRFIPPYNVIARSVSDAAIPIIQF